MISIAFKITIKEEKVAEFKRKVINQLTKSAKSNKCLEYEFYQRVENTRNFILHEKWKNKATWEGHLQTLLKIFGEKAEASMLPQK